jgi:dihydroorotate dehydrogenase (NAD+) catalytic subunit
MQPKLSVHIGRLRLANPVLVASGTFGYAEEFKEFVDLRKLGAIVTKTITIKARPGNFPPRTCETPAGMLNSIGLENPGLEIFLKEKLPILRKSGVPIIASIASENDPGEFIELVKRLDKADGIPAIELNISCPNVIDAASGKKKGLISQDPEATHKLIKAVRRYTKKTLITKLSPNVTDITKIAVAAESAGSDAVSLINTLGGMSIDVERRKPKIAAVTGGLSGPAIRPVAVRMVWETRQKIKIPIIGMGGIMDTPSALEFLIAGASAISIGTANFVDPSLSIKIISGLKDYLRRNAIKDIKYLIGSLKI